MREGFHRHLEFTSIESFPGPSEVSLLFILPENFLWVKENVPSGPRHVDPGIQMGLLLQQL